MSAVLLCQGTALALPLKDASVHCVVTSPPYYGLRDYGTAVWQGGDPDCPHAVRLASHQASSTLGGGKATVGHRQEGYRALCPRCGATRVDAQLGLEPTPDAYVAAMVQVFREVRRVLHPSGTVWINMGDSYNAAGRAGHGTRIGYKQGTNRASATGQDACRPQSAMLGEKQLLGMPWRLAFGLQQDGWILRSEIIWHKVNPMPESVQDRPSRSHEQIFMFSKQAQYFYDAVAVREPGSPNTHTRYAAGALAGSNGHKWMDSHGGSKPNDWGLEQVDGRNARTVWRIACEPLSMAHYAAFPTALVRRCLLAGAPSQVCSQCGAPWKREVDVSYINPGNRTTNGPRSLANRHQTAGFPVRLEKMVTDTGFCATCSCNAGTSNAVVLDPFVGSGTVPLVARELGHHAIGLDLSYPYLHDIARERLGLADLARWEGHAAPPPAEDYTVLPLFGGER